MRDDKLSSNADRFLDAYCRIEQALRKMVASDHYLKFFEMVKGAARTEPLVRQYRVDLLEMGELRNAIVHNRADGRIIAEPDDEAVATIERIAAHLSEPPRVLPLFKKKVITVDYRDPIGRAVKLLYGHSYSQLPVTDSGLTAALLTTNTITRWLGTAPEQRISLQDTAVGEVLEYTEHSDNFEFVGAGTTLFEIQDIFYCYYQRGKRLDAILITYGGNPAEELLGIITLRDLPLVQKELA